MTRGHQSALASGTPARGSVSIGQEVVHFVGQD